MNTQKEKIYELSCFQQDYEGAIAIAQDKKTQKDDDIIQIEAFCYFETQKYQQAAELYQKVGMSFQEGFCRFLSGELEKAREIWNDAQDSPAVLWGQIVVGIIDTQIYHFPTYFQIRNFFESTLSYLFAAKRYDYIEKLISAKEFLAEFNIETYRIIGKVLLENNWMELSKQYLEKAISELPQDYEAYYLLGLWYYKNEEAQKAKYFLKRCLDINDFYCSASKLIDKINEID